MTVAKIKAGQTWTNAQGSTVKIVDVETGDDGDVTAVRYQPEGGVPLVAEASLFFAGMKKA